MKKALIKIGYRQIIDSSCKSAFELDVLHESYEEFLLKSQAYNREGTFCSLSEMIAHDGRANSLHYKTGFVISPFIGSLKKKIPGIHDNLGNPLEFELYIFRLIDSHIKDRNQHKVSIDYITCELILLEAFGDWLLLTNETESPEAPGGFKTFLLKLWPGISIICFLEKPLEENALNIINSSFA